jgi:hypothetical protein
MRLMIWTAALVAAAGVALGVAPAQAGSPVGIVPGPVVPYEFPSPEYIPAAPPPPAASMPGVPAPPPVAAPLPPLVLYAAPPIALPLAMPSGRR